MRGDAVFTPTTVNGYAKPETVDAFEVGTKGAFLDRTLFVNSRWFSTRIYMGSARSRSRCPSSPAASPASVDNAG